MNNTKEILDDMRKITMLTGEISSVHEESLKNWPYITFDNVKEVKINYDLTKEYTQTNGEGFVEFDVKAEEKEYPALAYESLVAWVRDIFWKEIKVVVLLNGTIVHISGTKVDNGPKQD